MERRDYAAKLSFECSPLVLKQLDALVGEYGYRSRGELLRVWMENALYKERINQTVLAEIEKDHDRLGTPRPRRRPALSRPLGKWCVMPASAREPLPSPEAEGNAANGTGEPISPTDGPQAG